MRNIRALNRTSSKILRAEAGLAQEFRIVLPTKVKIKNSTSSFYSRLYGICLIRSIGRALVCFVLILLILIIIYRLHGWVFTIFCSFFVSEIHSFMSVLYHSHVLRSFSLLYEIAVIKKTNEWFRAKIWRQNGLLKEVISLCMLQKQTCWKEFFRDVCQEVHSFWWRACNAQAILRKTLLLFLLLLFRMPNF